MEGALFDFFGVVRTREKEAPKRRKGKREKKGRGYEWKVEKEEDEGGRWRKERIRLGGEGGRG